MKKIMFSKPSVVTLEDDPRGREQLSAKAEAVIRTVASIVSAGTELAIL